MFATEKVALLSTITVWLAGCVVIAGAIPAPIPEIATAAVEFAALLLMVRRPEILPSETGANFTIADVLCPAASETGRVELVTDRPVPETIIWLILTAAVPELVTVKV